MYLLENNCTDPAWNLALDEYLLTRFPGEVLTLWRNGPSVIIGKNQNALEEIDLDFVRVHQIPVVRRLTGGGAVFHDLGNINYTLVQPCGAGDFNNYAKFTKPIVDEWVQKLGLSINQVYNELVRNCDPLFLPEIERKELASYGIVQKGKAPKPWADPGNAWIDHCFGKRTQNRKALNGALGSFDPDKASSDSLVGRVFRKLCELCTDPEYGPYYAASLLSHQGYDLMSALDGAIRQAQEEKATQELQLRGNGSGGYDEYVMQCSSDFYHHTNKKNYQRYVEAVQQWYLIYNRYNECDDLATTLRNLKNELSALYQFLRIKAL